jgi:hypothetical protein
MELGSLAGKVVKVWGEEGGHIDIVTETKEGRKRFPQLHVVPLYLHPFLLRL